MSLKQLFPIDPNISFHVYIFSRLFIHSYVFLINSSFVTGRTVDNLDDKVSVSMCTKAPCRLRKRTSADVTMKFKLGLCDNVYNIVDILRLLFV